MPFAVKRTMQSFKTTKSCSCSHERENDYLTPNKKVLARGAIIKDEKIEGVSLVFSFEAETEVEPGKAKLADFAYSPAEAAFLHKVYEKNLL